MIDVSIKKIKSVMFLVLLFVTILIGVMITSPVEAATISLPAGSTSADLQMAINGAASGDVIKITENMSFTGTVTIPSGKEIAIQSDTGNNWTLTQTTTNIRHITVRGSLILQDITLDGNKIGGGVVVANGGSFTMNSNTTIQNSYATVTGNVIGGGVYVQGGSFTMNSGTIRDNMAIFYGGGVLADNGSTFTINGGEISGNATDAEGGGVSIRGSSTFTMNGGVIRNNTAPNYGAGVYILSSPFTMTDGAISGNTSDYGGGLHMNGGSFVMTGGKINDNTAITGGGGIYVSNNNTLTLDGGEISGNSAVRGGGVYTDESEFTVLNGEISGNTAEFSGGGVYITSSTFTMGGGAISGNTAKSSNGGGIYLPAFSTVEITGTSYITNNTAPNGNGGGIYAVDTTYTNLTTGIDTVFSGNKALNAYVPPENAEVLYPNIQFASTSITNHPLNNYDINYEGDPLAFHVTYDANGGTGSHIGSDIEPGSTNMILSLKDTGISRGGYTFTGWNTEPDGKGTAYAPGDEITLNNSITLYAQWKKQGGTGEHIWGEHIWYVCGYLDGSFQPDASLTRAEAAMIFYRLKLADATTTLDVTEFSDVTEGAWYYDAVIYSVQQGLVGGYGDGTFRPNTHISRAEFATIAARYDELDLSEENPFPDADGHWAEEYIASAVNKGWIEGYPDGTFKPDNDISRAEAVTLVNNVFDRRIKLEDIPDDVPGYTDLVESYGAYEAIIEASVTHKYKRKDNGYEIWLTWGN